MIEKLKPCPFCGGAAHASLAAYASGATAHALCDGCGAAVLGYGRGERGLRDAVKRWNRRAERMCRNASLDPECFRCSECGSEDYTSDSLTMWHEGGPVDICYCPVCGARIVEASE